MEKQCYNCKYAERPNKNCACNHRVKYPLVDIVAFKYHDNGLSYCDNFRPAHRWKK